MGHDNYKLACGHHIKFESNGEAYDWSFPEEDKEGIERDMWSILSCPDAERCSKKSWAKHKPWSLESKERCWDYLAHHLHASGNHMWKKTQVWAFLWDNEEGDMIEWHLEKDTFQDRSDWRKANNEWFAAQKDKQKKKKAKQGPVEQESDDNEGDGATQMTGSTTVQHAAVDNALINMLAAGASSSSRDAIPRGHMVSAMGLNIHRPTSNVDLVGVPREQLLAIRDSVSKEVLCVRRFDVEAVIHVSGKIGKCTNRLRRNPWLNRFEIES